MDTTQEWARQQWGTVELGDKRRNRLAVEMGWQMAEQPEASLPQQMGSWGSLKAAYRLLNNPAVSLTALPAPHCRQTRQQARVERVVLFPEDTTELDYTAHPSTIGLGPIGDGHGRGMLLHSTLAVVPTGRQVLGVAHAEVVLRQKKEAKQPKWRQTPEGQVWQTSAIAVGSPPEGVMWVHVSDRGSDIYEYLTTCRQQHKQFLIRVFRNRQLVWDEAFETKEETRLLDYARRLPVQPESDYEVNVAATAKQPARTAHLVLSWGQVWIAPPQEAPMAIRELEPLHAWVVRAWEPDPPEGAERVEWILLTSCPVTTLAEAQQIVDWYCCRWLCEDFHQCLKTGCRVEHSQLDDGTDIQRLLGFAIPLAVHLLQLRQAVRAVPDALAADYVEPAKVILLANYLHKNAETMTLAEFWRHVAQLGGHLGRRRDGPPGWRTLWRGWKLLSTWATGARLLAASP